MRGRRRHLVCAVSALCAVALGSGCAAEGRPANPPAMPFHAADEPEIATTEGLMVRAAFVLGPAPGARPYQEGADAAVYFSVVNPTGRADHLVDASSPAAADTVVASGGRAARVAIPPADPTVGDRDHVDIGRPPYSPHTVTLQGLTRPLRNGAIVSLTLEFERQGTMTFDVPVTPRSGALAALGVSTPRRG